MKRIELLGPSGVGKSTLFKKLGSVDQNNRHFLTQNEAFVVAAHKKVVPAKDIWLYSLKFILKYGLLRNKEIGIAKTILQVDSQKASMIKKDDFYHYQEAYDFMYKIMANSTKPFTKYKRLRDYLNRVNELIILERYLDKDSIVMIDEGILQGFVGLHTEELYHNEITESKVDKAINPDGVISCVQSAGQIYHQVKKRQEKGITNFTHSQFSDTELKQHIQKVVIDYEKKEKLFKKMNVPVLQINTGDNFNKNFKKINQFIEIVI